MGNLYQYQSELNCPGDGGQSVADETRTSEMDKLSTKELRHFSHNAPVISRRFWVGIRKDWCGGYELGNGSSGFEMGSFAC